MNTSDAECVSCGGCGAHFPAGDLDSKARQFTAHLDRGCDAGRRDWDGKATASGSAWHPPV